MASKFEHKRGDSVYWPVTYTPPEGGLPNLLGFTVSSEIKDSNGDRHELSAVLDETGLIITVTATGEQTEDWAVGVASWDVRYELTDLTKHTKTLEFTVVEQITLD